MKVYVVAGSHDWEGDSVEDSGKVFFDYEKAVAYGKSLVRKEGEYRGYDDFVLKEVVVE